MIWLHQAWVPGKCGFIATLVLLLGSRSPATRNTCPGWTRGSCSGFHCCPRSFNWATRPTQFLLSCAKVPTPSRLSVPVTTQPQQRVFLVPVPRYFASQLCSHVEIC